MVKKYAWVFLICLIGTGNLSIAQKHIVYMNYDYHNPEKEKVFELWKQYLNQATNTDTLWCQYDKVKYKDIDVLKDCCGLSGSLYKCGFDCSVISITPMGNSYLIESALYMQMEDSAFKDKPLLFGIADIVAVKEDDNYKLSNYINYATTGWNERTAGKIIYHYPPAYPFDALKAQYAGKFVSSLESWFVFKADTVNYYIPLNCSDGHKMVGFKYYLGDGSDLNLCGYYDELNSIIYSNATQGEAYKHELIHLINKVYPQANTYLLSGIAAYIDDAGSKGKSEKFHIKRYQEYLKTHPADFNKFYNISYIDELTAPQYIFGAVICNALLRKGGLPLLRQAMSQNMRKDEDFAAYVRTTFKESDLNKFFNKEFDVFLKQQSVLLSTDN